MKTLMNSNNHLYIYERNHGQERPSIYIGIGGLMRPYGGHNEDAEQLRDDDRTDILVTPEPFSTRADAREAEAIAIYVAALLGARVVMDDDAAETHKLVDETQKIVTNRSGVLSSQHLTPAVQVRKGTIDYSSLRATAFVTLTPEALEEGKPTLHGGRGAEDFAYRASRWWGLRRAFSSGYNPRRLLAVMKGTNIILGHWDLARDAPIVATDEDPSDYCIFDIVDPSQDDVDGVKGMTLTGYTGRENISWPQDISDAHGMRGQRPSR